MDTVLLIETNDESRLTRKRKLEASSVCVIEVRSVAEALTVLQTRHVGLVWAVDVWSETDWPTLQAAAAWAMPTIPLMATTNDWPTLKEWQGYTGLDLTLDRLSNVQHFDVQVEKSMLFQKRYQVVRMLQSALYAYNDGKYLCWPLVAVLLSLAAVAVAFSGGWLSVASIQEHGAAWSAAASMAALVVFLGGTGEGVGHNRIDTAFFGLTMAALLQLWASTITEASGVTALAGGVALFAAAVWMVVRCLGGLAIYVLLAGWIMLGLAKLLAGGARSVAAWFVR